MGRYEQLAQDIGRLVDAKQAAYGNSVEASETFFRALFPEGIKPEQYATVLLLVRMVDKMKRLATDPGAFNEDPWRDLAGYSLLGAARPKTTPPDVDAAKEALLRVWRKGCEDAVCTVSPTPAPVVVRDGVTATAYPNVLQPCSPSCEVCADLRAKAEGTTL